MSGADNLDELAEQVVNLWQDQLSALAADAETARVMEGWVRFCLGAGAGSSAWQTWPALLGALAAGSGPGGMRKEGDDGARNTASALDEAGAAPAAAAPRSGGDDLARLEKRLAALEERIARLEGPARGGSRPARRTGRGSRT